LGKFGGKTKGFSQIKNSIHLQATNESIQSAKVGLGQISVGKSFEKLLAFNGVKEETLSQQGLSFIRKKWELKPSISFGIRIKLVFRMGKSTTKRH
jgi:hypothetical protein